MVPVAVARCGRKCLNLIASAGGAEGALAIAVNPGPGIILWIVVGVVAGWLASRITGTDGQRGALANAFLGVLGALVGGFVTRASLAGLGYENLDIAGVAGALFATCVVVFGWHVFSRRHAGSRSS
jgi:uncharacterized membrane protein YeaQ/YmgE (transglycosylase-associated protein family)